MFNSNILQIVAVCLRRRLSLLYMNRKPKRENKQKQIFLFRFWNMFTEQSPTLQMCADHMCVCVLSMIVLLLPTTQWIKKNFLFHWKFNQIFFFIFLYSVIVFIDNWVQSRIENDRFLFVVESLVLISCLLQLGCPTNTITTIIIIINAITIGNECFVQQRKNQIKNEIQLLTPNVCACSWYDRFNKKKISFICLSVMLYLVFSCMCETFFRK